MSWYDLDSDGADLAPIAIRWKDGTPVASVGILGAGPEDWIVTEEVERAQRQEAISLATNVILLNDWRQR